MSFVFLSYAREDAALARQLAQYLANQRVDVFWDQQLRHGEDFRSIIRERLEAAACVLVLWSNHSVLSHWVVYEADEGLNRNSLMEARLDDSKPPPPFGILNVADLRGWTGDSLTAELRKLIDSVDSKLQTSGPPVISFAAPRKNQVVTDSHLALIHTCWRSEQHDAEYGQTMYMWDLMLYGSRQALNRVREVTY